MADNAQHNIHHHLNQQRAVPQLVSGQGVPHLIDPSQVVLAAAPPHLHSQHQFQPQHYGVLDNFWQQQVHEIRHGVHDFKVHQLPLARIKKVMKTDEEVKMISAEAPILFAKGCDIFITELTMRAWHHAEECKRRTLQRSDIANAIKKVDMFDFLIDIVPREDKVSAKTEKMEYQDHQNQYAYVGMPPSGHQYNSSNIPDHKMMVDPMVASLHEQQHLQHMQYMQRVESQHHQILHDHPEHQQHQHHQHPPTLLPPLTPVAGQQVSSYRARPQYASVDVSAGPSVRQVTTEPTYQHPHPHYYHHQNPSIQNFQQHPQELNHHQQQTPSQHQLHRQPDHNPVQMKYEFESPPVARPVEWYPQPNTQLANNGHHTRGYVQGNPHVSNNHGYGQPLSQSPHDYNHDSTGVRHDEGYARGGGVQRN